MTGRPRWGGARTGAGRKALDVVRTPQVKLERRHAEQLLVVREREDLPTDSDAIRWLLDRDAELAERREARRKR